MYARGIVWKWVTVKVKDNLEYGLKVFILTNCIYIDFKPLL